MKRKMERPIFIRNKDPLRKGSTLVVGIDKKGNITRFNETLEQLTGSAKKEVIDEPFSTHFSKQIPNEELQKLINEARFNPEGVDVDTSFQTVQGENMMISWTGFPIKNDTDGRVSQLNLVGTPQKQRLAAKNKKSQKKNSSDSSNKSSTKKKSKSKKSSTKTKSSKKPDQTKKNAKQEDSLKPDNSEEELKDPDKEQKHSKNKKSKKQSKEKNKKSAKTKKTKSQEKKKSSKKKKKKIRIKRNSKKAKSKTKKEKSADSANNRKDSDTQITEKLSKRFSLPKIQKPTLTKKKKKSSIPLPKISLFSKKSEKTEGPSSSKQKISDLQTIKSLQKTIKQLEKENKRLQKENIELDENLHSAELKKEELKEFLNDKFRFIRDSIGIKKKREEFKQMMKQLSERKQKLEQLETDMVLEKKEFKQKIEEFITWREKLEKLEQEIEKRRQFLSEQETFLNEQYDKVLSHELTQPATYTQQPEQEKPADQSEEPGILEKDDLFNSLTVEAAVLQRGRIKKANKRFAEMLGYNADELVGKHLVDFVGPNGLTGVEQHYMNRLKGVDDATYQTVFLSKSDDEIPVKVNVKTGDFKGERAEIATFNEI